MIRVIHVIRALYKAGAEKLCVDICHALHKRSDVEVLLVSMSPINCFESLTKDLPLRIINSKVRPSILGKSIIDIEEFVKVVEEFKPDIIHSHLFWSELMSRELIFPNVKYITHCHDNMVELNSLSWNVLWSKGHLTRYFERYWIMKKYKQCNNNFIAISNDNRNYFLKILPEKLKNKMVVMHNAIDFGKYARPHNDSNHDQIRPLQLVNIGRFDSNKNQRFLLYVIKEIMEYEPNIQLHFYGTGEFLDEIKEKASKVSNNIFFHGSVDDIPNRLWNADLYVHSAHHESYGLVLIEAMAAGLPVITLDGKGNRDIIEQGENGYMIFNPPNAKEFANTILKVWNDKEQYKRLSKNAIEFAKKHDMVEYAANLVEYYKSLLNSPN
jgi:glycosyltransferase involved in cell wall biosynthesis